MKKALFLLLILALFQPLIAQEVGFDEDEALRQLNPPALNYGGLDGSGDGVVGAIPATVDVGALGGAVYSIPIQVPKGIFGMQPDLSIVYNSQGGNGLLGWGWNLGGVSAITRVGPSVYFDGYAKGVDFSGSDRFALDGQRLVVLDGATYGSNGAEYKTEVDGMSKIVSYTASGFNGPKWFRVWTENGLVLEYGATANSRLQFSDGTDYEVGMWLLNKVSDRNGNFMLYQYNNDGESVTLSRVNYTRRGNLPGCYSVNFVYDTLNEVELSFIGNHPVKQAQLLDSITVKWWDEVMWSYGFSYMEGGGQGTPDYYKRLESIRFACGDNHYNPTRIVWGERPAGIYNTNFPNCHDFYLTSVNHVEPSGGLHGNIKFAGDFNGDGLSDLVVVERADDKGESQGFLSADADSLETGHRSVTREMRIYLNGGHTKEDGVPGTLSLNCAQHNVYPSPSYTYNLIDANWIYVCDFNGDGLDDIVILGSSYSFPNTGDTYTLYALKSVIQSDGTWDLQRVTFSNNQLINYWFTYVGFLQSRTLLTGDFMGRGRDDLILACNSGHYQHFIYFTYNEQTNLIEPYESVSDWVGTRYATCDYDGDGKTEVWFANGGQNGKLVRLCQNQNGQYTYEQVRQCFDSSCRLFPGDFNGDGKTDFLAYHSNMGTWEIVTNVLDDANYCYDVSGIMNTSTNNEDPGDYAYDFSTRESGASMHFFIGVFDVNGDGKSDVVVNNNINSTSILYGPLRWEQGTWAFSNVDNLNSQYNGFNADDTYGLCVGNFLGQENMSLLCDTKLISRPQNSTCYSVDTIIDGMGNWSRFRYGYLVHNPMKGDNIFTLSDQGGNSSLSVLCRPLPVKAVGEVSGGNLHSGVPVSSRSFRHENVLVHKFGRGALGFARDTVVTRLSDSLQSMTMRLYSTGDIPGYPVSVLSNEMTYGPMGVLNAKTEYGYSKFKCTRSSGNKVFFPALCRRAVDTYDPIDGTFFSRTIEQTVYTTSTKDGNYYGYLYSVAPCTKTVGVDPGNLVTSASLCEFQTVTDIYFEMPDHSDWVIHRPHSVHTTHRHLDNTSADVESLTVYEYLHDNPFQVTSSTDYPGADLDNDNGLASVVVYEYDSVGNVQYRTLRALDNTLVSRTTGYEYDYNQLVVTETNALGYESQTDHNHYWELQSSTDCNGLSTLHWCSDHLGLTDWVKRPDLTYGCKATRWAFDNSGTPVAHAPDSAAYYTWAQSTGEAPVLVFYDASGRELRTVTEDIDGNAIYRDTEYDRLGRLWKQWEPYYSTGTRGHCVEYGYDACHRQDTVRYPDGTAKGMRYLLCPGSSKVTEAFYSNDGSVHGTSTESNVAGWTTECQDQSNTIVFYYYYADGRLKKAGLDPNVDIAMKYDDAGNRTDITDPDYGHQHSVYNAFGELTSVTTPKGDVTEYVMDALGRVVKRYDRDNTSNTVDSTLWMYGTESGEKGLLKSVRYNDYRQVLGYTYDTLCRTVAVSDSRGYGQRPYQTSYGYDANGRVNRITYPTGYVVKREYDNGRLRYIRDARDNMLWHTLSENAFGLITAYETGNFVTDTLGYDGYTHLLTNQFAAKNTTVIQDFIYEWDDFRNLASRTENKFNTPLTETFGYDNLDRLDTVLLNNSVLSAMGYDQYGRMQYRTSENSDLFWDASYNSQAKPHAMREADFDTYSHPEMKAKSIAYTIFDKVKWIRQGNDTLTIKYGCDRQRISMADHDHDHNSTVVKTYVGSCEYIHGENRERRLTYISGPLGVFAVYEELGDLYKDPGTNSTAGAENDSLSDGVFVGALYYLYRDHLGSVTTVTDENGAIVQELSYDAWGNLRDPYSWTWGFTGTPMFDRGYTGHEHLWRYCLINMDGRMYDPLLCCFLSVDSYVQDPSDAQSFNRYAYCMNNPLKYVDPTGDFLTWSINQNGFSIGVNFTPAGVPVGVGINIGWANGGSVGFYSEVAYRTGGFSAGAQISYDYYFAAERGTWTVSAFTSFSYGSLTLGGSVGWNLTDKSFLWGVSAGLGFMNSNSNSYSGCGLSVGYGSGGWSWGINGFYNRMQKPYVILSETANANPNGVDAVFQLEDSHDCVKQVLTWFESIKGGSLTEEDIQACIALFTKEDYVNGRCSRDDIGKTKDLVSLFNYAEKKGWTAEYLIKKKTNYNEMCKQLYDVINDGGLVMVNCEGEMGHAVGVERVNHTVRSNILGNIVSEYSFRVMNPAPIQYGGGYRPFSGGAIWEARNVGWLRIR